MPAGKPEKIRVPNDGRCCDKAGKLADGRLFIAVVSGAFPEGYKRSSDVDWRDVKQWIAYVHIFDADGTHIKTDSSLVVMDRDIEQLSRKSDAVLNRLLETNEVVNPEHGYVDVRLFSVKVNGIRHSLTYHIKRYSDNPDDYYEYVDFQPVDVAFNPPWDSGLYDT